MASDNLFSNRHTWDLPTNMQRNKGAAESNVRSRTWFSMTLQSSSSMSTMFGNIVLESVNASLARAHCALLNKHLGVAGVWGMGMLECLPFLDAGREREKASGVILGVIVQDSKTIWAKC